MQKLTRRHVLTTMTASTVMLCPAILNAASPAELGWADSVPDNVPAGVDDIMMLADGETQIEVSGLVPGDVAVFGRPSADPIFGRTGGFQYIAVLRRTNDQMAAVGSDAQYYVANLVCPHRGFAIGITNDPTQPFACTKRGSRHASIFGADGGGISGASSDEALIVPAHTIDEQEDGSAIVTLT